jgi:hypothetical protein
MAAETTYFVVEYNTLAGGSFTALTDTLLTWVTGSGSAFIVTAIENADGRRRDPALPCLRTA